MKVTVFDSMRITLHELDFEEIHTGNQIIKTLLQKGKIPKTNLNCDLIDYKLVSSRGVINSYSLKEAGVTNGEILILRQSIMGH